MTSPPANCPRCSARLRNEHGDLVCLVHGTVWFAARPWDAIEEPSPERKTFIAPNAGRPWSVADRAYVLANKDRMSSKAMAQHLRRTEHSVNQLLSKRGVRKARMANLAEVRKRANAVEQLEDRAVPGRMGHLARRLGLTYWQAYKRLWNRGILVREADGKLSISEVAGEYGCTRDRVQRLIDLGVLPAERVGRTVVRIAPEDAEQVAAMLRARSKHDPRRKTG